MKPILLSIIIILTFATISFFAWLAYHNSNSDKILPEAIKLLAATILATSLFSIDFFGVEKSNSLTKVLMLYHDNSETFDLSSITSSIDSKMGEGFGLFKCLPSANKTTTIKDLKIDIAFEDLNYGLLHWLSKNNSIHWDNSQVWNQGISGGMVQ